MLINRLQNYKSTANEAAIAKISEMYQQFKQAYESRNDSRIISFMGDDWEAGDGTTLSDMQVHLSRIFRKFDEVTFSIQNMKIAPFQQGYNVNYDLTISSRIYKKNLRHQEKSAVTEFVSFTGNNAKITKTMSGNYWLIE